MGRKMGSKNKPKVVVVGSKEPEPRSYIPPGKWSVQNVLDDPLPPILPPPVVIALQPDKDQVSISMSKAVGDFQVLLEKNGLLGRYEIDDKHRALARKAIEDALMSTDIDQRMKGVKGLLEIERAAQDEENERFKREQLLNGKPTEIILTGSEFDREIDLIGGRLRNL